MEHAETKQMPSNILALADDVLMDVLDLAVTYPSDALQISHTCGRLRFVALNYSSIWARNITSDGISERLLSICLERSKSAGLDVTISPDGFCRKTFLELIIGVAERWANLVIDLEQINTKADALQGFLEFSALCADLRLPQLKCFTIHAPFKLFGQSMTGTMQYLHNESIPQFYTHWDTPNLESASFIRILPARLNCSPRMLNLHLPPLGLIPEYDSQYRSRILDLLSTVPSLQELQIRFMFGTEHLLERSEQQTRITMPNLDVLKMHIAASDERSFIAPRLLLEAVRMPRLSHITIQLDCDSYATDLVQSDEGADLLSSLIPGPDSRENLTNVELIVKQLLAPLVDLCPTLRLTDVLQQICHLRSLVIETDFIVLPLSTQEGQTTFVRPPQLERVEFRRCVTQRTKNLEDWSKNLNAVQTVHNELSADSVLLIRRTQNETQADEPRTL